MVLVLYGILAVPLLTAAAIVLSRTGSFIKTVHCAGNLATGCLAALLIASVYTDGPIHTGMLYADALSVFLLLIVTVLSNTAAFFSASYMEREIGQAENALKVLKRYYILLNIFSFTMIGVLLVENLGLMWVAVEATTLSSALLVAFYLNRPAIEAAWKYVMICTVGISFALLGTILLYYAQVSAGIPGDGEALGWLTLRQTGRYLDVGMVKLAFVFIVIGYGTKAGLAPMHTWLPDAHSQAPSPVSGLLSGALLSCALYAIMRNMAIIAGTAGLVFVQQLLLALGLLSVAIAIPFILVQHDFKRLLAYSSVENMGIITFALGVGTPLAAYGALFHTLNHALAKSALFYAAGNIIQEYRTKHILRISGLLATMPFVGTVFLLLLLGITGSPPFSVFFSKLIILWAAFGGGYRWEGILLLILLAAVFAGMMYYAAQILFRRHGGEVKAAALPVPAMAALLLSLAFLTVTGFYLPAVLQTLMQQAAAIILGGSYAQI
ncbi:nadh:ubiquinone oxidoreductase [Lucifera butyrica]|uniref:Nadh:ubiquinone oxidoreductase n=1 Tax=Lucifera butyrica TaxID=1351585 RepID=A0A498R923_9FIRM|nr:hydrogenase 4 subunit F [Lucifera butyrica]VBB06772.1 nadh:ubiquinone oxidoreductase [Lucifera butyrica]